MDITYFIGNGFDIAAGLGTSAKEVIAKYREHVTAELSDATTPELRVLSRSLRKDYKAWSDFEMALATTLARECLVCNDPIIVYKNAYEHFVAYLYNFLREKEELIEGYKPTDAQLKAFANGSRSVLKDGLRPVQRRVLDSFLKKHERQGWKINFVTFNYTSLLDILVEGVRSNSQIPTNIMIEHAVLSREPQKPIHVHGWLADGHGIVVGPDNTSQFEADIIAASESVQWRCVKPLANEAKEDLAPEEANSLIARSSIIAIFGMSLGKSDETWWRAIGSWLEKETQDKLLIIHLLAPERDYLPFEHRERVETARNTFFQRAGITEMENRKILQEHILVSENSSAFQLGIDFSKSSA